MSTNIQARQYDDDDEEGDSMWDSRDELPKANSTAYSGATLLDKFRYKPEENSQVSSTSTSFNSTSSRATDVSPEPTSSTNMYLSMAEKLQTGQAMPAKPIKNPSMGANKKSKAIEDLDETITITDSEEREQGGDESEVFEVDNGELFVASPSRAPSLFMNPANKKKKKRIILDSDEEDDAKEVISIGDDSEDEQSIVSASSGRHRRGRRNSFDSSSGDEDADRESRAIAMVMAKCESISTNLKGTLVSAGQGQTGSLMTEESAQNMIGNEKLQLKPYQVAGVNWLSILDQSNINGVLADEMGLGKTIQAVAFLRLLLVRDNVRGPHLVVAPASTVENWERELKTWLPELNCMQYNGSQKERAALRKRTNRGKEEAVDVWITTYTYFERDSCHDDRKFLYGLSLNVCVYDEAHAIKNVDSQRYKYLVQLKSRRRLLLSGTPVQNRLDELFALLSFCLPTVFSAEKSKLREKVFGAESDPEKVKRILAPFILRRLKHNVLSQLSPKVEEIVMIDMLPLQKEMYEQVLRDFAQFREDYSKGATGGKRRNQASAVATSESIFTELRKISNHPLMVKRRFGFGNRDMKVVAHELLRTQYFGKQATLKMVEDEISKYSDWDLNSLCLQFSDNKALSGMVLPEQDMFETSAKACKLREIVPKLVEEGHRVLLFSQWTTLLDIFEELMNQINVSYMRLDGSTAVEERQNLVDEFNSGLAPVFLLSTRAGGLGINLTSADVVILHDLDFNPAIDSQAMDRCHRIGQTKKVRVIKLVTAGTVDETIYKIQQQKTGLNKVVLGETDGHRGEQDDHYKVLLPSAQDYQAGVQDESDVDKNEIMQSALEQAIEAVQAK